MSEETTNPESGEGSEGAAAATTTVEERPHRGADLAELEEELCAVVLREHYTIPRDGHKQPHKGPKKLNMPLSDAKAHMHKLQEHEAIRDRWKAIQREKEHRRAERNLAGDITKPSKA